MRTEEQTRHLEKLLNAIKDPNNAGPFDAPSVGHTGHCTAGRPVWLIRHTTLQMAYNLAVEEDREAWTKRSPWAPWISRPDRKAIERDHYGLTTEEVKLIRQTDHVPLPHDIREGRRVWRQRQTNLLAQIVKAGRPTYTVSPQPT